MKIRINEDRQECGECGTISRGLVWVVKSDVIGSLFEDEAVLCTECVWQASALLDEPT